MYMTRLAQSHNSVNQNIIAMHDRQGYDDRIADFVNKERNIIAPLLLIIAAEEKASHHVTLPSLA